MVDNVGWMARSELDCARFGLEVYRSQQAILPLDVKGTIASMVRMGVDILILRVEAGELRTPQSLTSDAYEVIYADSIVYYSIKLPLHKDHSVQEKQDLVFIRPAETTDCEGVELVALDSFTDYRSHYAASPSLFDPNSVVAGYAQWATDHIRHMSRARPAFVATKNAKVVGFLTCATNPSGKSLEVLLNAVSSTQRRQGIYSRLLHAALAHAQRIGCQELLISTQLSNIAVQRAWTRLGLSITNAMDTYHVRKRQPKQSGEAQ